jgi:hypothetical protein
MTIPEQKGRPVWEPVVIALCLALLLAYDRAELLTLLQGRAAVTAVARAALELGVAAMMVWGLAKSLVKAATWTPGGDDAA